MRATQTHSTLPTPDPPHTNSSFQYYVIHGLIVLRLSVKVSIAAVAQGNCLDNIFLKLENRHADMEFGTPEFGAPLDFGMFLAAARMLMILGGRP